MSQSITQTWESNYASLSKPGSALNGSGTSSPATSDESNEDHGSSNPGRPATPQ